MINVSIEFRLLFVQFDDSYYLAYVQSSHRDRPNEILVKSEEYCSSITEVFNEQFANLHLLRRIKYYHMPCQINPKLHCFYDEEYMCFCEDDRRANCLTFSHNNTYKCLESDGDCQNGGQCFQDKQNCPTSSACLCPMCYYGFKCQFSAYGLFLSLDAILCYHIQPHVYLTNQSTIVKISIGLTTAMLTIGTLSGFLCILTFRVKKLHIVGCGIYLFGASISFLTSAWIFACKFLFLLLFQVQIFTNHSLLLAQCVLLDSLLQISIRFGDWVISCVAFVRLLNVIQGIHFNQSKSKRIAKRISCLLLLFIISTTIHDSFFRELIYDEEEQRTWCVVRYSTSLRTFNSTLNFFHFLVPVMTNFISALVIIIVVARTRSIIHKNSSFKQHLIQQLRKHKHLLISPIILTVLALPRLIIAISNCMTSVREPYLYLVAYFLPISPSLLIFSIFVLTSETYRKTFLKSIKIHLTRQIFRN